jgi:hypothetical protein
VAQEVESKRMVKEAVGQREDRLADSAATQPSASGCWR